MLKDEQMTEIAQYAFNAVADYDLKGNAITDYRVLFMGPYGASLFRAFRAIEAAARREALHQVLNFVAAVSKDWKDAGDTLKHYAAEYISDNIDSLLYQPAPSDGEIYVEMQGKEGE